MIIKVTDYDNDNLYRAKYVFVVKQFLGDNDQGCAGVVCEVPEGSGGMMQSKPERS